MLWSIDNCRNRVYADQCHITVSQAQLYNSLRWFGFKALRWPDIVLNGSQAQVHFQIRFSLLLVYDKSWISSERHFFKDPTRTLLLALAKLTLGLPALHTCFKQACCMRFLAPLVFRFAVNWFLLSSCLKMRWPITREINLQKLFLFISLSPLYTRGVHTFNLESKIWSVKNPYSILD